MDGGTDAGTSRIRDRWRGVARSLVAGAAYDLAFAAAILFFHRPAAGWMGLVPPDDPVYLRLAGVLLAMLGAIYLVAARRPADHRGVVLVATVGRLTGGLYLGGVWWAGGAPAFAWLGLADLGFAAWHAGAIWVAWRPQVAETQAA